MSALDLYSIDWVFERVRDYLAAVRPSTVVVFGTEQDWQFQSKEEERVVVGAAKDHVLAPPGPPGAPGESDLISTPDLGGWTGTNAPRFDGDPAGLYHVVVEVTTPGALGVAQARYSLDGGANYSTPATVTGPLTLGASGLIFTPGAGALSGSASAVVQRCSPFATLRQGVWIAVRAVCAATVPDDQRVMESQRRAFSVLRWVLFAIDRVSHGSNTLRLAGKVTLEGPETADYQHGGLLRAQLSLDVPIYGAPRDVVGLVQSNPLTGQARIIERVEALRQDGTSQLVVETT